MKNRIAKMFLFTVVGLFLCAAIISCKNFMNAGQIKAEIEEAIEIANSNPVTIYITADEGSGSVVPEQIVKKKKESFEIKFTPQTNWKFLNWEVIDKTTGEVVTDAVAFADATKTETKAILLKPNANYQIHAKCVLLPAIVSVSPSNLQSCPVNTQVYITFNMPMEDPAIKPGDSIFKYDAEYDAGNVSIYCGGDNMKDYFDEPSFYDSEKKVLVITPRTELLKYLIEEVIKTAYIDITVSFGKNICVKNNETILSLSKETGNSVTIRYTSQKETTPPKEYDFFVTNKEISIESASSLLSQPQQHFNYDGIYNDYTEIGIQKMLQNRTNGTIHIYGKYYDKDSGVRAVTVKEKLVNNKEDQTSVISETFTHVYLFGTPGAEFIRDAGGNTLFCIECNLNSEDGAVSIQIEISDVAGNSAPLKNLVAIKKSCVDMDFTVMNGTGLNELINESLYTDGNPDHKPISEQAIKKQLITFEIHKAGDFPSFYPVLSPDLEFIKNNYKIQCKYGNKEVSEIKVIDSGIGIYWQFEIDVQSISGLEFTIIISDDIGNTSQKKYKVPELNNITYYKEAAPDSEEEFAYIISKETGTGIVGGYYIETIDNKLYANLIECQGHTQDSFLILQKNKSYSISPQIRDSEQTYCFYTSGMNLSYGIGSETVPEVVLKKDSQTNKVYKIKKTDELCYSAPALKISVFIDDTSWQNNKYDCIMLSYGGYEKSLFEYGKTTCTILVPTMNLLTMDFPITVYGFKNGKRTNGTDILISKQPASEYDNIKPHEIPYEKDLYDTNNNKIDTESNCVRSSWNSYTIKVMDDESGPRSEDSGVINIRGIKDSFIADSNGIIELPIKNVVHEYWTDGTGHEHRDNYLYIDYWFYDEADNCQYKKDYALNIGYIPVVESFSVDTDNNTLTLQSEEYYGMLTMPDKFELYQFSKDDGDNYYSWKNVAEKTKQAVYDYSYSGYIYKATFATSYDGTNESEYIDLPQGKYIKVIASYGSQYSIPSYIYTGAPSYKKGDIIQSHTNNSVLIQSTQPAFVHTVVTTAPYSECANWEPQDWEYFNDYLCEDLLDFSTYPMQLEYEIPVDSIDSGCCYAVVAHFASGKTAVSQVFQK